MVYTWYIACVCRPDRYVKYIPCQELMGLFRTFFYNDIPWIYNEYLKDIHCISTVYHYMLCSSHLNLRIFRPRLHHTDEDIVPVF